MSNVYTSDLCISMKPPSTIEIFLYLLLLSIPENTLGDSNRHINTKKLPSTECRKKMRKLNRSSRDFQMRTKLNVGIRIEQDKFSQSLGYGTIGQNKSYIPEYQILSADSTSSEFNFAQRHIRAAQYSTQNNSLVQKEEGSTRNNTGRVFVVEDPAGMGPQLDNKLLPKEGNKKEATETEKFVILGVASFIIHSSLIFAALMRFIILKFDLSIGIHAPMLLYGIMIGVLSRIFRKNLPLQNSYNLYFLVVPIMLYRICFDADLKGFKKNFPQTVVISAPGLIANAVLVGIMIRYFLAKDWSFVGSTVFGTPCVSIYPKENIERMRQLGSQPQRIAILLEGEAIIGTLVAYAMYRLLLTGYWGFFSAPQQVVVFFLRYLLGGILVGCIIGKINCFFFWAMSANILNMLLFSTVTPLLAYYLCSYAIGTSGLIAISICGLMMDSERTILNRSSKILLREYWQIIIVIIDAIVSACVGFLMGRKLVWFSEYVDYVYMILTYCATYFGRFLIYVMMAPLVSRLGYGMNFRGMVLAVWGGVPSLINICFTILPWDVEQKTNEAESMLFFYVSGMTIIALLLNVITVPYLLSFLRMDVVSSSREMHLRLCMKHLTKVARRALMSMKMESLMGETNWKTVEYVPLLKSPYGREFRNAEEEEFQYITFCPDCNQEIYIPPSHTEYSKLKEEANLRIFKTRETLQIEMFSQGLISKKSFKVLNGILRRAYDHPKNQLQVDELLKLFRTEMVCKKFRRKQKCGYSFKCKMYDYSVRPPNFYWRRLCYHLIRNSVFHMIVVVVLIHNIVFIVVEAFLNNEPSAEQRIVFTCFDAAFLMFYILECLIIVASGSTKSFWKDGFSNYFRSPFHTFSFVILITVLVSFIAETLCYISLDTEEFLHKNRIWFMLLKVVRVLRFIEFCGFVQKKTKEIMEKKKHKKLLEAYNIGKDFLSQEKKVLEILPSLCEDYHMRMSFQEEIERMLDDVVQKMNKVQNNVPWITTTVKTKYAATLVISYMIGAIEGLMVSGWIDNSEKTVLISNLSSLARKLQRKKKIGNNDPERIFENVAWFRGFPATREALFQKVELKRFDSEKVVLQKGDVSNGIYINLTGVCDISYVPNEESMMRLEKYGELPVVDNITSKNFEIPMTNNYVISGMTFGELSFLTGRPYAANVVVDSPCEFYFLPSAAIRDVMDLDSDPDDGLECRMWKSVSTRLATSILFEANGSSPERREYYDAIMTRFYMPQLPNYEPCTVEEFIEHVVLIEGIVQDSGTGKYYTAPCKIPKYVKQMIFPENRVLARLLFVPIKEVEQCAITFQDINMAEVFSIKETGDQIASTTERTDKFSSAVYSVSNDDLLSSSHRSIDSEKKGVRKKIGFDPDLYYDRDF